MKPECIDLHPSGGNLKLQLANAAERATSIGKRPFVYVCSTILPPSVAINKSMQNDHLMQDAFAGTYIIRIDCHEWHSQEAHTMLAETKIPSLVCPVFYEIDEHGIATGRRINGDAWGIDTPVSMAPPLKEFFNNGARQPAFEKSRPQGCEIPKVILVNENQSEIPPVFLVAEAVPDDEERPKMDRRDGSTDQAFWWEAYLGTTMTGQRGIAILRPSFVAFLPTGKKSNLISGAIGAVMSVQSISLDFRRSRSGDMWQMVSELWIDHRERFDEIVYEIVDELGGEILSRSETQVGKGMMGPVFRCGRRQLSIRGRIAPAAMQMLERWPQEYFKHAILYRQLAFAALLIGGLMLIGFLLHTFFRP